MTELKDKLKRLDIEDCTCPWEWRGIGKLYGISFGEDWIRMSTDSSCRHHNAK